MAVKYTCVACRKEVAATKNHRYRSHTDTDGNPCEMSSDEIPEHVEPTPDGADPDVPRDGLDYGVCACGRKVQLTRLGYFEPHDKTLKGGDRCEKSGTRYRPKKEEPAPEPEEAPSPESTSTSPPSPTPDPPASSPLPWPMKAPVSTLFLQPFSPFLQPEEIPVKVKPAESMTDQGREIAARLREIFYAYTNRNSSDNRSAQRTLGPSEIGTACDRKLAMKLAGCPVMRPSEGWASFVGTAVHAELEKMFDWANGADSGRFLTEMRLRFGSEVVPRGTTDLLDRVLLTVFDHKNMGKYSLDKLIQSGPTPLYRVQAHTYGYGVEQAGEKIKYVAIIGWPRQESNLDKLYVHVEPYDRKIALDAIARAERIQRDLTGGRAVHDFDMADDCRFCPFKSKGAGGCPGV